MSESTREVAPVTLDAVHPILVEHGYLVERIDDHVRITDPDSGMIIRSALEGGVMLNTVVLTTVDDAQITPEAARRMLDAENGITTSFFKLFRTSDEGRTAVTLNNFCKLQSLGADDLDDMLSSLDFLEIDALQAREELSGLLGDRRASPEEAG